TAEVAYTFGDPAVVNDPVMADLVRRVAEQVVGPDRVVEAEPSMGGEDFATTSSKNRDAFSLSA
ncbi:M20/M25/M40 family metallo-hydrolase, partial [Calditerricola satsumensis]|uniref:M20/M25/M40 family metallo-hydrolase n=1 Tax=Calditerricola satsumensis TaxID=373054 RepID=UPI0006D09D25